MENDLNLPDLGYPSRVAKALSDAATTSPTGGPPQLQPLHKFLDDTMLAMQAFSYRITIEHEKGEGRLDAMGCYSKTALDSILDASHHLQDIISTMKMVLVSLDSEEFSRNSFSIPAHHLIRVAGAMAKYRAYRLDDPDEIGELPYEYIVAETRLWMSILISNRDNESSVEIRRLALEALTELRALDREHTKRHTWQRPRTRGHR